MCQIASLLILMVSLSLANRPPGIFFFWGLAVASLFSSLTSDEFFWHSDVMWLALWSYIFCRWLLPPHSPQSLFLLFSFYVSVVSRLLDLSSLSISRSYCHRFFSVSRSPLLYVSMCGRERSYWPTFAGLGMVHSLPPPSPGTALEDPTYSTAERERLQDSFRQ